MTKEDMEKGYLLNDNANDKEVSHEQRVAYRLGKLSNAEISDFSPSRRVSRVEPPISNVFDKLREG